MRFLSVIPRYFVALVLTISACGLYGAFLSPLIEGDSQIVKALPDVPLEHRPAELIKQDLTGYFPDDGWEWQPCTILETKHARILFQDHKVLDDGAVELTPFSMVLNSRTKIVDGRSVAAQPIILRAPEGARLKFERPLSASGDMGELEHGQLIGEVQIFRPASSPGKNDSLYMVTQNVQVSPERIFTLYDCNFRFGESYGRGKRLTVDLFGPTADSPRDSPTFAGIERIELARVYELYLHREQKTRLYAPGKEPRDSDLLGDTQRSFLITSDGPMHLDFLTRTASFQDKVLVRSAAGDQDQLSCDKLTVVFSKSSSADPGALHDDRAKPQVQRLVAEGRPGQPAVITSVSRKAQVVARNIDYNLIENRVTLTADDDVSITRNDQRIQAREIRYRFTDDGRIGEAVMMGPGSMSHPGENGKDQIICHWQKKLTLQEDNGKKVLSMDRGRIEMNVTTVQADQMHLWVWEVPEPAEEGKKQRWRFEPAKMFATGDVTIESPDLAGRCTEAAAFWPEPALTARHQPSQVFVARYRPVARTSTWQEPQGTYQEDSRNNALSWQSSTTASGLAWQNQAQPSGHERPSVYWQEDSQTSMVRPASGHQDETPSRSMTHFVGSQIQLQMRGGNRRGEVQELTVEGDVVVRQKQSDSGGVEKTSLEIRGQKLRVMTQPGERYRLFVSGRQDAEATVRMENIQMRGNLIHLDQAANRLWIEGPGQMQMAGTGLATNQAPPLQGDQFRQESGLLSSGDTTVQWQGGMVFDGQVIYFETAVVSNSRQTDRRDASITTTASRCAALSIALDQGVDFSTINSREQAPAVKVSKLVMVGEMKAGDVAFPDYWQAASDSQAWVAIGKYDPSGKINSNQEILAKRATLEVVSGAVKCEGPGTLIARQLAKNSSSVRTQFASTGQSGSRRRGPLEFIKVDFDTVFQGNTEGKELVFEGNVHTFYTDSNDWNTVPGEAVILQPGSQGIVLDCDHLLLAQWTPRSSEPTVEMIATGNSRVKGGQFNANAERISYYQGTGQVVIEAPTRSNAEIWFKRPGQTSKGHLIAKTITYNVDSGEYQVQEMKQIEYSQQGPLRGR